MNSFELLVVTLVLGITGVMTLKNEFQAVLFGLISTIVTFVEMIIMWSQFDSSIVGYQWETKWNLPLNWVFGIDGLSIWLIMLTGLLIPICILSNWDSIKIMRREFVVAYILLEILLILVFSVLDILLFYVFFETILIPMFYIIGIWGSREQKVQAAYYFFFYTLLGSVLMLIGIMWIYVTYGTTDLRLIETTNIDINVQNWLFIAFFASLAVKVPMFPFHLWLPQAHVEAPLSGSILLAGVLLKLGGYGFIRYVLAILPEASVYFSPLVMTMSAVAVIYASLTTIRQIDMKRLIAYSSVAHMSIVTIGIFSGSAQGISGSIILMLAHGFVSSALFIIVTILYDRHHSRIFKYYRGVTITMPIYSTIFFFFTLANIAAPLTANFIGEFLVLAGSLSYSFLITFLAATGMVLSAAYSLYFYNRVAFGTMSLYLINSTENRDVTRREFWVLVPLIIPTIYFGVYPELVLNTLQTYVSSLI
uniref:NADH-ubiquinone oxidoreductase chain 4 n=1 Tax=Capsaspora owczarzaki TaxID=192875 RepID=M1JEW1_9EUKA|nr:NADH dehydrogenase subunit 4 [Capsaspora owczarzaki]